jgi:exodeoxyribonuclease VII small subunit
VIKKLAVRQREGDCSRTKVHLYNRANHCPYPTMTKANSSKSASTKAQALPETYEAGLLELEQLVSTLESGQMPLADLLQAYQRGAFLLNHCREQLKAVEAQIQVLEAGSLKSWTDDT